MKHNDKEHNTSGKANEHDGNPKTEQSNRNSLKVYIHYVKTARKFYMYFYT
jgi:hypothetical protein